MNQARSISSIATVVGALLLFLGVVFAQPATPESEHQAHHPITQSQATPIQPGAGQGMGMMGEQGMMGGQQMMRMPMMTCCPWE